MAQPFLPRITINPDHPRKLLALGKKIEEQQAELNVLRSECRQLENSLGHHGHDDDWTDLFKRQLTIARAEKRLIPLLRQYEMGVDVLETERYRKAQDELQKVEADRRKELGLAPGEILNMIQKQSHAPWVRAYKAACVFPPSSRGGEISQYQDYLDREIPRLKNLVEAEADRVKAIRQGVTARPQPTTSQALRYEQEREAERSRREQLTAAQELLT